MAVMSGGWGSMSLGVLLLYVHIRVQLSKLALQIIEMAPTTYCVTYKTGPYTRCQGERKIVRRAHYTAHRGIRVPGYRRD